MTKIKVTGTEWEPQNESISADEFDALLAEVPKEIVLEVESVDEFEDDPAGFLDTDNLKVVGLHWEKID